MTPLEIETDVRYGIGPVTDLYDHGPVTVFTRPADQPGGETEFVACLECGYVAQDARLFLGTDCGREHNTINQTWGEWLDDRGDGDAFDI